MSGAEADQSALISCKAYTLPKIVAASNELRHLIYLEYAVNTTRWTTIDVPGLQPQWPVQQVELQTNPNGHWVLFVLCSGGKIYSIRDWNQINATWYDHGASNARQISVATTGEVGMDNRIAVFALDEAGAVRCTRQDGNYAWQPWESLGGHDIVEIAACRTGFAQVIYGLGMDADVYYRERTYPYGNDPTWKDWNKIRKPS